MFRDNAEKKVNRILAKIRRIDDDRTALLAELAEVRESLKETLEDVDHRISLHGEEPYIPLDNADAVDEILAKTEYESMSAEEAFPGLGPETPKTTDANLTAEEYAEAYQEYSRQPARYFTEEDGRLPDQQTTPVQYSETPVAYYNEEGALIYPGEHSDQNTMPQSVTDILSSADTLAQAVSEFSADPGNRNAYAAMLTAASGYTANRKLFLSNDQ